MTQPTNPGTQKLLSPSLLHRVGSEEADRKPIPRDKLQSTLGEIGIAASHDMPSSGEAALLRFKDGTETPLVVDGYTKDLAQVTFPTPNGAGQASNIHLGAFEELTRETRNELPQ